MLDLYLDESGIHGGQYCIAAGFLAQATVWDGWEDRWRAVLRKYGVTAFHAKRFFARDKQAQRLDEYADWSDAKARHFIKELAMLVNARNELTPVAYAVNIPEFNGCTVHERHYLTGAHWQKGKWRFMGVPTKPHGAAFILSVNHALEGHTNMVNLFHDEQNLYAPYLLKLHARAKALNKYDGRMGPLVFDRKDNLVALQAADFLAYCTFHRLTYGSAQAREMRIAFEGLSGYSEPYRLLEGIYLERLLSKVPAEIRQGLTRSQLAQQLKAERSRSKH